MNTAIATQMITCPDCGCEFELTEAIRKRIEEDAANKYRELYRTNIKEAEKEAKEKAEKEAEDKYLLKLESLQSQVDEKDTKLKDIQVRESEIQKKELDLKKQLQDFEKQVNEQVNKRTSDIEKKAKDNALKENSLKMVDLETQVTELQGKLSTAHETELDLRKKQRELVAEKKEWDIAKERELDAAKDEIYHRAKSESDTDYKLKLRDKDLKLEQLTKTVEQLNKKLEQGSQQLQGESQELELEEFLSTNFMNDIVSPVPKGFRGADIIQTVKTKFGLDCGKIIWESKRTNTKWGGDWISKLKEDQRDAKADIAVIVSQVLPEGVSNIAQRDGVWIVSFEAAYGIAIALREQLLLIDQIKKSQIGKNEKAEVLYDYLCSNEFRQKIEGIVEAFTTMRTDLESEKRAINKHWQKREMQIDRVLKNTTGMYGGLQALIGSALPEIKALEMPVAEEEALLIPEEVKEEVKEEALPLPIEDEEDNLQWDNTNKQWISNK